MVAVVKNNANVVMALKWLDLVCPSSCECTLDKMSGTTVPGHILIIISVTACPALLSLLPQSKREAYP